MREKIEVKLRRIAMDRSGKKYTFGLSHWVVMDNNVYVTFLRRDTNGNFMNIKEVYDINWLI